MTPKLEPQLTAKLEPQLKEPQLSVIEPITVTKSSTEKLAPMTQNICVYFKERSWIRIFDKNKKHLYEGFGNIGDILFLTGKPPFSMKVGHISGVYVEEYCDIKRIISYPKQKGHKNLFIVGTEQ